MSKQKNCPKCPGGLISFQSKTGASYDGCPLCKGIWLSVEDAPKIFSSVKVLEFLGKDKLRKQMKTKFSCPECAQFLQSGNVGDSDLTLEECTHCQSYFFDNKEMKLLYDEMTKPELPVVPPLKVDFDKMIQLNSHCPICKDQRLWSTQGEEEKFSSCLKCGGVSSNVAALSKMAGHSLFSPTMFVFRDGQGVMAICRYCSEAQDGTNSACRKCGREIFRPQCISCSGRMSEYILGSVVIDRCQICNSVWLDESEFEKVMIAMPDVRRHYEAGVRQSELLETEVLAASHVYAHGLEQATRVMVNRFWGVWGSFSFFD